MMNNFSGGPFFGLGPMSIAGISVIFIALFLIFIALKGYALWNAAKRDEKWWFIILLVVNTFGILELVYLYFVVGKWHSKSSPVQVRDNNTSTNPSNNPPANPTPAI